MRRLFIFNILVLFFLLLSSFSCSSYPSDKCLIENFDTNKSDFEKLVVMIQEDNQIISVMKNGEVLDIRYQANNQILTKERLKEYQLLLNKINASEIRIYTDNKKDNSNFSSISIFAWDTRSWSIVGGGHSKSYSFQFEKPEKIVESLDEIKSRGGDASHYKKISENWYLYLDIW